jgi:hypothetical protein
VSTATFTTIKNSILTALQGATFEAPGISQANIRLLKVLTNLEQDIAAAGVSYPCLLVAPFGNEQLDPSKGTNVSDDITYPVVVVMSDADEQDQQKNAELYDNWQQTVREAFHNKRLTGASLVFRCAVEALANPDVQSWMDNSLYVWGLVIKATTREQRP